MIINARWQLDKTRSRTRTRKDAEKDAEGNGKAKNAIFFRGLRGFFIWRGFVND